MTDWIAVSYATVIIALTSVALYALAYPTLIAKYFSSKEGAVLNDLEGFLTARNSQSKWRIAFSFYAGSVGAWAITTPASYSTFAGWVGMVFYALACGLPIIVLAFFGNFVKDKYPTAGALGDVILMRFGPTLRFVTCVVALFNMAIFMLAEFTTIGGLFKDFVGSLAYPIIIVTALLTTVYSAYGGLLVSIVTDQIQAGTSLLFLVVLCIYVWATFDQPLVEGFGDLKASLGPNEAGYGAIFVMPMSLMAATIFNEGMWQRVWAAENPAALKQGGIMGCVAVVIAIFLYGLIGFIAAWGGLIDFVNTNPNLYLFQIFKTSPDQPPNAILDSGIEVLTLILALVMSESAIDSLQNGISATISSTFLRGKPIMYARAIVVLINIIIVPFALANYNVLSLFLSANMLGCCWFVPILIGGVWDTPTSRKMISETTIILGGVTAILAVSIYGITDGPKQCADAATSGAIFPPYPDICRCATAAQLAAVDFGEEMTGTVNCGAAGVAWAWVKHPYMWQHFVLIVFISPLAVFVFGVIALQLPESVPGISDILGLASHRHVPEPEQTSDGKNAPMPIVVNEMPMMMMSPVTMSPSGMPKMDPYGMQSSMPMMDPYGMQMQQTQMQMPQPYNPYQGMQGMSPMPVAPGYPYPMMGGPNVQYGFS